MKTTPSPRSRAAALAALLVGGTGCFQYVPLEPGAVSPGPDVRVELTRVGFAQLPELPALAGPDVFGRLERTDGPAYFLSVPVAVRRDGLITQTIEQQIVIPSDHVVRMERRVFSRPRTALMAAGVLTIAGVIASAFGNGEPSTSGPPEATPEIEAGSGLSISIPLF